MSNTNLFTEETICCNKSRYERKILFAILAIGLTFRLIGFNFGLPYAYNCDEPSFYQPAYNILATGDLNPHWFGHPGSTLMYALALVGGFVLGIIFLYNLCTGKVSGAEDFIRSVGKNPDMTPALFIFIGRLMAIATAVFGIYLLYLIATRLINKKAALISSLCLALAPLHVDHSRLIRTDVPGTTFILLVIFLVLKFYDNPTKTRYLILASLSAGLAIATKYTFGLIVVPILLITIYNDLQIGFRNFILNTIKLRNLTSIACSFIFIGFFIGAPFVILDYKNALLNLKHEMRGEHLSAKSLPSLGNYWWYSNTALRCGIGGIFIEIIAAYGLLKFMYKKSLMNLTVSIFPLLFFIIIPLGHLKWERWFIPLLPFEALFFSIGLLSIYKIILDQKIKNSFKIAIIFFLSLPAIFNLLLAAKYDIENAIKLTRTDMRTLGKEWIENNIPLNSKISFEAYTPHLNIKPRKDLILERFSKIVSNDLVYYNDNKYDYIVLSESLKKRFLLEQDKYPLQIKRYEEIEDNLHVIKTFADPSRPVPSFTI